MSDFYKKFLVEEVPKATPGTNKQIFLAAFGKHPGWDDHVEDLGLDTESLIAAKTLLYVKGIGGEIDAGAWEKLDPSQVLPGFRHIFVWQRGGQSIVGRLWASSDGKGRTRYPMVVCAHCSGLPLPWVLEQVLPRLERLEQACTETTSATEVKSALGRVRVELREIATRSPDTATTPNGPLQRERFLSSTQFGENHEGLLRILYQMQSQFAHFAQGKFNPRADASTIRPQHVRVPWGAEAADLTVLLWSQLMQSQIDGAVPILYLAPLQDSWIDITLGEPTREEMFCLRASLKSVPLASEIPYNLDESFRLQARGILEAFLVGRKPAPLRPAEPSTSTASAADRGKPKGLLSRWFGALVLVLALSVAGVWMSSRRSDRAATGSGRDPAAPAATPPAVSAVDPARPSSGEPAPASTPAAVAPAPAPGAIAPAPPAAATAVAQTEAEKPPSTAAVPTPVEMERAKVEAEQARQLEQAKAKLAAEEKARMEAAAKIEQTRLAEAKKAAEERARREREAAKAAAEQAAQSVAIAPKATTPAPVAAAPPTPAVAPAAHSTTRMDSPGFTNSIGMTFVRLPSGYFAGRFEVTEGQFKKVTGRSVLAKTHGENHPVQNVSWIDAEGFCRKLTETERASGWLGTQWRYALPTEKQWVEFVADAKLEDSVMSLNRPMPRVQPEPVGGRRGSNQFGLFDVRGNVWEWCLRANNQMVLRGGAYSVKGANVASVEYSHGPVASNAVIAAAGFRCVMVRQPPTPDR